MMPRRPHLGPLMLACVLAASGCAAFDPNPTAVAPLGGPTAVAPAGGSPAAPAAAAIALRGQARVLEAPLAGATIAVRDAATQAALATTGEAGEARADAQGRYAVRVAGARPGRILELVATAPDGRRLTALFAVAPAKGGRYAVLQANVGALQRIGEDGEVDATPGTTAAARALVAIVRLAAMAEDADPLTLLDGALRQADAEVERLEAYLQANPAEAETLTRATTDGAALQAMLGRAGVSEGLQALTGQAVADLGEALAARGGPRPEALFTAEDLALIEREAGITIRLSPDGGFLIDLPDDLPGPGEPGGPGDLPGQPPTGPGGPLPPEDDPIFLAPEDAGGADDTNGALTLNGAARLSDPAFAPTVALRYGTSAGGAGLFKVEVSQDDGDDDLEQVVARVAKGSGVSFTGAGQATLGTGTVTLPGRTLGLSLARDAAAAPATEAVEVDGATATLTAAQAKWAGWLRVPSVGNLAVGKLVVYETADHLWLVATYAATNDAATIATKGQATSLTTSYLTAAGGTEATWLIRSRAGDTAERRMTLDAGAL